MLIWATGPITFHIFSLWLFPNYFENPPKMQEQRIMTRLGCLSPHPFNNCGNELSFWSELELCVRKLSHNSQWTWMTNILLKVSLLLFLLPLWDPCWGIEGLVVLLQKALLKMLQGFVILMATQMKFAIALWKVCFNCKCLKNLGYWFLDDWFVVVSLKEWFLPMSEGLLLFGCHSNGICSWNVVKFIVHIVANDIAYLH